MAKVKKARRKKSPVVRVLIDTSVWLDLAKDYREQPVISALEDLVRLHVLELAVPQLVLNEFNRNKARVIEETRRGLQSHFRQVCEAVVRFGDKDKLDTLTAIHEIDHKMVTKGEAVNDSIARIERLLHTSAAIETSDAIKQRVTDRALVGQAPYHRSKNSVGDAVLVEMYADLIAADQGEVAFVTHNFKDFSDADGDRRKPHADLASLFNSKSTYWVSIVDMIRSVAADLLQDHTSEFNYSQPARRLSEIVEAEHLLMKQVWYNRHWNTRLEIEEGKVRLVPEKHYPRPYQPGLIIDKVWKGALESAKRTEKEVGLENLGPWDDFEWGMINGKLSALRWVLGEDWDELYT